MKNIILLSALILLLFSCESDVKIDFENIEGKWEMLSAKRNGNPTSTLDKSFFNFNNGELTHNINGDTINSSYSIEKNNLMVTDPFLKELEIKKLQNDTIEIKTKISNLKFEFLMKKINE